MKLIPIAFPGLPHQENPIILLLPLVLGHISEAQPMSAGIRQLDQMQPSRRGRNFAHYLIAAAEELYR